MSFKFVQMGKNKTGVKNSQTKVYSCVVTVQLFSDNVYQNDNS